MRRGQSGKRQDVEFGVVGGRLAVRGDCSVASAPLIESWLAGFRQTLVEVDLSGVTFFDSAALLVFLRAVRRNPGIRVVRPSVYVLRVLEWTNTADYLVHGRDLFD